MPEHLYLSHNTPTTYSRWAEVRGPLSHQLLPASLLGSRAYTHLWTSFCSLPFICVFACVHTYEHIPQRERGSRRTTCCKQFYPEFGPQVWNSGGQAWCLYPLSRLSSPPLFLLKMSHFPDVFTWQRNLGSKGNTKHTEWLLTHS